MEFALTSIAHRIDVGFSIQVRSAPPELPPAADDKEAEALDAEAEREQGLHAQIAALQKDLAFPQLDGEPILGELGDGAADDAEDTPPS